MNPNTFKLGYSQTWSDSWYSNNKLYPLMLNSMLNVRALVYYIFNKKRIEKMDIYLSHMQLGLNSGCLYISLFFYNTTFNTLNTDHRKFWKFTRVQRRKRNKYKVARNYYDKFDFYLKDVFLRYPWFWPKLKYRVLNVEDLYRNYHNQSFFLFFNYLGFSPDVFIFNYYKKNLGSISNWRWNRMVNKKRLVKTKKWLYINVRECYFLFLFYKVLLQKKAGLNWLSNDKDDLHLMRLLRYLFFYGRMPFWGKRHYNLTIDWNKKEIKNLRQNKFISKYRSFFYKRNLNKNIRVKDIMLKIAKKKNFTLLRRKNIVKLLGDIYFNLFYARIFIKNSKNTKYGFLKKEKKYLK